MQGGFEFDPESAHANIDQERSYMTSMFTSFNVPLASPVPQAASSSTTGGPSFMDASMSMVNEPPDEELELPPALDPPEDEELELPPVAEFAPLVPPLAAELPPELGPAAPRPVPGPWSTVGLQE